MVKAISGVMTVRFKNELVRNITIKLGYANAKVRISQDRSSSSRLDISSRSTNAQTKIARDQDVIVLTAQTKKMILLASDQVAAIK